jgi:molybdate transport system substrate-binding protein
MRVLFLTRMPAGRHRYNMRLIQNIISLLACAVLFAPATYCQDVSVAAAADLKFALDDLAAGYKKESGVSIKPTYGSSGNFFMQIQNGAPFDVFLSADVEYPRKLEAAGLIEPGTFQPFATGRIVLWMRPDSTIDLSRLGWKALLDPNVKKISIASPDHAPYGRAAVAALRGAGIYDQVREKMVYGENISQAAQFVQSGNAEAGIIALSLALSPAMQNGKRWDIPVDTYPRIEQAAVVLKAASEKAAARAFLAFLRSDAARVVLQRYGFDTPGRR